MTIPESSREQIQMIVMYRSSGEAHQGYNHESLDPLADSDCVDSRLPATFRTPTERSISQAARSDGRVTPGRTNKTCRLSDRQARWVMGLPGDSCSPNRTVAAELRASARVRSWYPPADSRVP